jgi:hypothetical protein
MAISVFCHFFQRLGDDVSTVQSATSILSALNADRTTLTQLRFESGHSCDCEISNSSFDVFSHRNLNYF